MTRQNLYKKPPDKLSDPVVLIPFLALHRLLRHPHAPPPAPPSSCSTACSATSPHSRRTIAFTPAPRSSPALLLVLFHAPQEKFCFEDIPASIYSLDDARCAYSGRPRSPQTPATVGYNAGRGREAGAAGAAEHR